MSLELARRVGASGAVVGVDMDATVLERAAADARAAGIGNVEFRTGDASEVGGGPYDVAYARFLLSHVGDPAVVIRTMVRAVRPGGAVVVEDTDFTGSFCSPPSAPFERWIALYRETLSLRGGNADVGKTLPSLLDGAGLTDVMISIRQPCAREGDVKLLQAITIDRIADAVSSEGVASTAEVAELAAAVRDYCADPTTLVSTPRVVQSWGRVPDASPDQNISGQGTHRERGGAP